MRRRMGGVDFDSARSAFQEMGRQANLMWAVYEDYELVDTGENWPYLKAVGAPVRYYNPLFDAPRLFLDFTRIAGDKDPEAAMFAWITKYGLLGLSNPEPGFFWERAPETVVPPLEYKDSGGPGDTMVTAIDHAHIANELLLLYEACENRDTVALQALLDPSNLRAFANEQGKSLTQLWNEQNERATEDSKSQGVLWVRDMVGGTLVQRPQPIDWEGFLVDTAMAEIWGNLVSVLSVFAYPTLAPTVEAAPLTADRLVTAWGARNLLGVIYLQFYFLVTSGEYLFRCKYCSRIISLDPPVPNTKKRKARKDKKFCDSRCRQNYHYHNRQNPERPSG